MQDIAEARQPGLPGPLRKIKTALTHPGAFFRYRSNSARSFYHTLSRIAHIRTNARRCNVETYPGKKLNIKDSDGYALFAPEQVPDNLASAVTQEILQRIEKTDIEALRKSSYKPYLLTLLKPQDIARDTAIYKLMTHPEIVGCVARYLKCFPILTSMAVLYSPNLPGEEAGSQKYHLDHEDQRQVKAFLFIKDIGPENGPFTLLPASESEKAQKALGYNMTPDNKQIDDEAIYTVADKSTARSLTGEAGSLALIDTSRCFHYGSREGTAPRIMLTFQYLTPFAYVMPWNWQKKTLLPHLHDKNMSQLERKLLGLEA